MLLSELSTAARQFSCPPAAILIEIPHIREGSGDFKAGLLENAFGAGEIAGVVSERLKPERLLLRTANRWRAEIGINRPSREMAKDIGKRLARKAFGDNGLEPPAGPRGGDWEHALEAMCMAMAAWSMGKREGWILASSCALETWRETGSFNANNGDRR